VRHGTLILIPAFNEARKLGAVLTAIGRIVPELPILVVDDGSTDGTAAAARREGAVVVSHPLNLGYGAAIQTGYRYALRHGFSGVVQLDADGQHDAESILRILEKLDAGHDLVLGSRFLERGSYRPPFARLVGIRIFSFLVRLALRRRITDATTGFQGLSRRLMAFYDGRGAFPHDYPDANMIIRAGRAGFRFAEVPVRMRANPEGGHLHVGFKPLLYVLKMTFAIGVEVSRRLPMVEE
jgi:glycosyltransferase involved in cell wall biosynthesis